MSEMLRESWICCWRDVAGEVDWGGFTPRRMVEVMFVEKKEYVSSSMRRHMRKMVAMEMGEEAEEDSRRSMGIRLYMSMLLSIDVVLLSVRMMEGRGRGCGVGDCWRGEGERTD